MSAAMSLSTLLDGMADVPASRDVVVSGLSASSRELSRGDAFVALQGLSSHGLRYAAQARDAGASAILFEPPLPTEFAAEAANSDLFPVPGLRNWLGRIADRFHDRPSAALSVIGVTGTNGKTSTVQLLAQALHRAEAPVGTIGTLGCGLFPQVEAGERTTPDVVAVHRLLAGLRERGARFVAMEVSSHALDQGRVDGVRFDIAVFSNLTQDHLDYHGDMASYGAAKARLFQRPELRAAVVNLDDAFGRELHAALPDSLLRIGVSAGGRDDAALRAEDVALDGNGIAFTLVGGGERAVVTSPLLGRFNIDNLLAVGGCLKALDWPLPKIAASLSQLTPVHGRMSRLGGGDQPLLVVDYAHTPDALTQSLQSLRSHTQGRLICVFGCGGERDRGKRPLMAAAAEALADHVVVTDDNPRNEEGDAIVTGIMAGFRDAGAVQVVRDREQAIRLAVSVAQAGDTVLIAGKGHEPYQESGGVRRPFEDLEVARRALEERA
ncbi:MAG: UDP-N-acetylmuramoyl-L-alanyl-D-glutamate--2,6-diaminopimelate ligase [Xanthomonadales bacterium]|nr:UDP-N-acetylmuramoyl-L-alanyl-D-glutamate--2,6-diaminopimelate ligase [Xanthomonadales bacterium]